jgi:hypothetical protein
VSQDGTTARRALGGTHIRSNYLERPREQRITDQNRDRITINFVARRPAAPEIVIIHGRQIVVHKRIGMDHFHGARRRQSILHLAAARPSGKEHKPRPQPLPGGQERITNCFGQNGRATVVKTGISIQSSIDSRLKSIGVGSGSFGNV